MYIKKKDYIALHGEEAWAEFNKKQNAAHKRYLDSHKEKVAEWRSNYKSRAANNQKEYRERHKDELKDKNKEWCSNYYHTYSGRSRNLIHKYTQSDIEENRGDCTLTPEWVIDNIFTSSCVYCGDSEWEHLGCDRIDNSKPHTPENCICACGICNIDRQLQEMSVEEFKEYRKNNPRKCDIKKEGV